MMAYKIVRQSTNVHQAGTEITAILDTIADLNALGNDYAAGSVCRVANDNPIEFMMNASGRWVQITGDYDAAASALGTGMLGSMVLGG